MSRIAPIKMSANSEREEAIFERVLELSSSEARDAYLRATCGNDVDLLEQLQSLLEAHDRASRYLAGRAAPAESSGTAAPPSICRTCGQPLAGEALQGLCPSCLLIDGLEAGPLGIVADRQGIASVNQPAPAGTLLGPAALPVHPDRPTEGEPETGDRIGHYRLVEQVGVGGMGSVWMAEQEQPIRRQVALKIIKLGMDTRSVIARFEAERQALAMMDHPNIARVFDAGATERGRPYFVMELVRGLRICNYCDTHRLPIRERLQLFDQICRAVQHAHQKGIIHRDLKPSNILVTIQDGRPVVKVIDFGIAKATQDRLTDKTLFTDVQQILGTPSYMSPEQATLGRLDIDTRSDIYSLGVVLYELLTGRPPFDTAELLKSGYEAVLRTIRETEPVKPSTRLKQERLAQLGDSAPSEIQNPESKIDSDLDWIVMKCLEKDRARRYETPHSLALDIERFLQDEPVLARSPSLLYRWQKFARKHRAAVAAVASFVLLLGAGATTSTVLALKANREREQAVAAQTKASSKEREARQAEAEAKDILRFFEENLLAATRPRGQHGGLGREVTVRMALDAAEPKIRQAFTNQPLAEASIRETLGMTYHHLAEPGHALRQHERALSLRQARLGPGHPQTLDSMNRLAMAHIGLGQLANAERLLKAALTHAQANSNASEVFSFMDNLATVYSRTGRSSDAVALLENALEGSKAQRGPDDHSTLRILNNLADAYSQSGQRDHALPLWEESLRRTRRLLGDEDPDTLSVMNNLSVVYRSAGRLDEAVDLSEDAVRIGDDILGRDHPITLTWRRNLALVCRDLRRTNDALRLFGEIVDLLEGKSDSGSAERFRARKELARFCVEADQLARAQSLWQTLLVEQRDRLPPDDLALAETLSGLGDCFLRQGRYAQAEPLLLQAHETLPPLATPGQSRSRQGLRKQVIERIVHLYESWDLASPNAGRGERAAEWKRRLADVSSRSTN